jgi:CspA family cold shock protein
MHTGVVTWFNNAKGYGFVVAENSEEDIFVHYSAIDMEGYKTLKSGQCVQFDLEDGPKGSHAVNIKCQEAAEVSEKKATS